jgi:hypothetical protein
MSKDTGEGIPVERIWKAFCKAHSTAPLFEMPKGNKKRGAPGRGAASCTR